MKGLSNRYTSMLQLFYQFVKHVLHHKCLSSFVVLRQELFKNIDGYYTHKVLTDLRLVYWTAKWIHLFSSRLLRLWVSKIENAINNQILSVSPDAPDSSHNWQSAVSQHCRHDLLYVSIHVCSCAFKIVL